MRNLLSKLFTSKKQNNNNHYKSEYKETDFLCNRIFNLKQTDWSDIYIPLDQKVVGIYISGGMKSSILAFLLAKIIKENELDIKILPLTWKERKEEYNTSVATNIIERINSILNIDNIFLPHTYLYFRGSNRNIFEDVHEWEIKQKKRVAYIYSCLYYDPEKPSDMKYKKSVYITRPFTFMNLDYILELYIKYNLLDILVPYTRSCNASMEQSMFFRKNCNLCSKCNERNESFKRFKNIDPDYIPPRRELIKKCESL